MAKQKRRFGKATRAITDPETGRVLGWSYRWDDGEASSLAAADVPDGLPTASDATGPGQGGRTADDEEA